MRLKPVFFALCISFAGAHVPAGFAQDRPAAEAQADPAVTQAARAMIEETLKLSHAAEIFADLRRSLREVYIPAIRDFVQGGMPGVPAPDAAAAAKIAKLLTLLDYVRKAGDEFNAALSENREAMISDAAQEIAKTTKLPAVEDVRKVLNLPAIRKGLDAFYAASKLVTGFSYGDSRTFSEFSAWIARQDFDFQQSITGMPGGGGVPSKPKIAKAQALLSDFMTLSHADEITADVRRFVREVYVEMAPMSGEDRDELREQVDQLEFLYNMQKSVMLAAGPSIVAAALTDEELATLQGFVRSAAFVKAFDLVRDAVKSGTALTKDDVLEAQKAFETLEKNAKAEERSSAEQERAKANWDALADKWAHILENRISPETRSGLERSFQDLQAERAPI